MKRMLIVLLLTVILLTTAASAQTINIKNASTVTIVKHAFYNNTENIALSAQTFPDSAEPLVIVDTNQTIVIDFEQWGRDTSHGGAVVSVNNDSAFPPTLMPFQLHERQIDQVMYGNLKIVVGMTHIYRGQPWEYVKICVAIYKMPRK